MLVMYTAFSKKGTYRVTGKTPDGSPIDLTMLETVLLRRSGEQFRIVHFHWSTSDPAFNARTLGERLPPPAR